MSYGLILDGKFIPLKFKRYAIYIYPTKRGFLNAKRRLLCAELGPTDWMPCGRANQHWRKAIKDVPPGFKYIVMLRNDGMIIKELTLQEGK